MFQTISCVITTSSRDHETNIYFSGIGIKICLVPGHEDLQDYNLCDMGLCGFYYFLNLYFLLSPYFVL